MVAVENLLRPLQEAQEARNRPVQGVPERDKICSPEGEPEGTQVLTLPSFWRC